MHTEWAEVRANRWPEIVQSIREYVSAVANSETSSWNLSAAEWDDFHRMAVTDISGHLKIDPELEKDALSDRAVRNELYLEMLRYGYNID